MSAEPRPGIRDVAPYDSPQMEVVARLNTNECPIPLAGDFSADLARVVADLPLNRYPDSQALQLRDALARHAGHYLEGTWAANGSNEILTEILLAYGGPGRTAMVFGPTYLLHARLAWLTSTTLIESTLGPGFSLGSEQIALAWGATPHIVFVCSPNNPTGNAHPVAAIAELAAGLPSSLIVVDQAYVEFGGQSALPLVADFPNVVVVRTLSKAFALAGARVGYCLAAPDVVGDLQRVRLPYHLSSLTQAAGLAALRHASVMHAILDVVRTERDRIFDGLRALEGVTAYPSDANFVLFTPPDSVSAKDLWSALLERGVLIRDLTAVVPEGLRVTAGAPHEVDLFLSSMKEVLA